MSEKEQAMLTIDQLLPTLPQTGLVRWLGVRPARHEPMQVLTEILVTPEQGIIADRYRSSRGKRQVTLVQFEHLGAIASMLGRESIAPQDLRRNIVVQGINLLALKDQRFTLGTALLECTGLCHPCSRMEATFGSGGYNAVRGHGGITATVISAGRIAAGDSLQLAGKRDGQ